MASIATREVLGHEDVHTTIWYTRGKLQINLRFINGIRNALCPGILYVPENTIRWAAHGDGMIDRYSKWQNITMAYVFINE